MYFFTYKSVDTVIILGSVVNIYSMERRTNEGNVAISVPPPGPVVLLEAPGGIVLSPSDPKKFKCENIPPFLQSGVQVG